MLNIFSCSYWPYVGFPLEKYLFRFSTHFKHWIVCLLLRFSTHFKNWIVCLLLRCMSSLFILNINFFIKGDAIVPTLLIRRKNTQRGEESTESEPGYVNMPKLRLCMCVCVYTHIFFIYSPLDEWATL